MRKKELVVVNIVIGLMVVVFALITIRLSINQDISSLIASFFQSQSKDKVVAKEEIAACSKKEPIKFSAKEDDPHLLKLKEYQAVCGSFVTDKLMIFTGFPKDALAAEADAKVIADKLILLNKAGITPLVIAEPYAEDGAVSYRNFLNGAYDQAFQTYFQKIRDAGVSDEMMGTWVPFPESNTPEWNNKDTEPRDFALCVNKYLATLKAQFPSAKGSILLSATTYDPNDTEYNNGDYIDLTPYVQDIDKNLVTSLGIQGFPWVSNASVKRREIFKAAEFLQPDLAIAAARELRTRDIWFNTGSFATKYAQDDEKRVTISSTERKAILNSILEVAGSLRNYQQNEYRVSLNIFSEDKSDAGEATDWSYFQSVDSKAVLKEFLAKVNDLEIPLSLYDREK